VGLALRYIVCDVKGVERRVVLEERHAVIMQLAMPTAASRWLRYQPRRGARYARAASERFEREAQSVSDSCKR